MTRSLLLRAPALTVAALCLALAVVATTVAAPRPRATAARTRPALTKAQVKRMIARAVARHAGPRGATGPQGPPGPPGPRGDRGPAGPTTTLAPSGSTQRGAFAATGQASAAGQYVARTSVSFPLRLAGAPTVVQVPSGATNLHCPGTPQDPEAERGYLCLYVSIDGNVRQVNPPDDFYPQDPATLNFGASTFGTLLSAESAAAGYVEVIGSWAVTAP